MEIPVISIGNSKGIRLAKAIIEQYHIEDTLELVLGKDYLILKPKRQPRQGWENDFRKMHEQGEDHLLIDDVFEDENFDKWS